ncbi:hypothetical protein MW887_010319 [Aspergillus wentii]|nr:hypothetical protein MW887_010319 [Aspergillus wentii]
MGGVPFKSTGCNTCRRRKVKCDEAKPECMKCVKNGHVCTGYERNRVFIHKTSGNDTQKLVCRSKPATGSSKKPQPIEVASEIPHLNANPQVRSQLAASFIDSYLPPGQYITGKNLFETLPDLAGRSQLLDKAIISLSTAFVATQQRDDRLLQSSTRLYGNAMETLHGRIMSGNNLSKDILYTTVIFQVYELCDAVGKRKAASLYNALASHDPSQDTADPEPVDEFIDMLIECTALLEQVDRLIQNENSDFEYTRKTGERLMQACLSLEEKLHRTCLAMQGKLGAPSSLKCDASSKQNWKSSISLDVFPDAVHFPSLTCAESHLLYWTALVLIYPLFDQLLDLLGQTGSSMASPITSPSLSGGPISPSQSVESQCEADFTTLADHFASEICRSVEYFIQPDMKTLGAQLLLAPLSQSTQFFYVQESTEKHRWCQGVFVLMGQLGLGIAPLLKDMVWPEYRAAQKKKPLAPPRPVEAIS